MPTPILPTKLDLLSQSLSAITQIQQTLEYLNKYSWHPTEELELGSGNGEVDSAILTIIDYLTQEIGKLN